MKGVVILNGLMALLVFSAGTAPAAAGDDEQSAGKTVPQTQTTPRPPDKPLVANDRPVHRVPVYVPPLRGAPVARVGGGTRGGGDDLPYVTVVTPKDTGYTSSPQPVLYWYLSEPVDTRFEFALVNDDEIDPVFKISSRREMRKGLNYLDLSEHGVSLKPGVIYQWSVALVGRPEQRSGDIVSSGTIELVAPTAAQAAALQQANATESVTIYARMGYWYDAFTRLCRLIDANPGDAGLRAMRTALLRQVGLDGVADAAD